METNPYTPPLANASPKLESTQFPSHQFALAGLSWLGLGTSLCFLWELGADLGYLSESTFISVFGIAVAAVPFALGTTWWQAWNPSSRWPWSLAAILGVSPGLISAVAVFYFGLT